MMRFEYKRALGHAWYLHKAYWCYAFLFSCASLFYHMVDVDKNGSSYYKVAKDEVFYLIAAQVLVCLTLFILSIVYPRDTPFTNRQFIRGPNEMVGETLLQNEFEDTRTFDGRDELLMSVRGSIVLTESHR
jgi:hypothetical protein